MEIKIASKKEALEGFDLVAKNYQEEKYFPTLEAKNVWLQEAEAKYESRLKNGGGFTLVAVDDGKVVGTMTLEFNPTELCIDTTFPEEMAEVRMKSFAYFGGFAIDKRYSCTRTSMRIIRWVWELLKPQGFEIGICVVNKKHCKNYTRLGFQEIAKKKNMPGLSEKAEAFFLVANANKVTIRGVA